ncbi:MAG TPA: class I SAM-dependent methyltransferase [Steroidobacteraceae bacterium]|nr:class I SAM-dependent methyltransferase [Steroidobacteraceae bacterium]
MQPAIKAALRHLVRPAPPSALARNFVPVSSAGLADVEGALRRCYFPTHFDTAAQYLESGPGRTDMANHMTQRLEVFRTTIAPWFCDARSLQGASVLEIGCGIGASTVALAEQGAKVTAIDVDAPSLEVARTRCAAYGVEAEFHELNAVEAFSVLSGRSFDFIIFCAVLEHMTHAERLAALGASWRMLAGGGLLGIVEAPNRLWFFDSHTALLPFYMWLPDELAILYASRSPRKSFAPVGRRAVRDDYAAASPEEMLEFLRHGRGVSFHEFDLALGPAGQLDVVSSLESYMRGRRPLRRVRYACSRDGRYSRFLRSLQPDLHPGFYEPYLDLIIRKPF